MPQRILFTNNWINSVFKLTDDSGAEYKYYAAQLAYDPVEGCTPIKASFSDHNSAAHKLFTGIGHNLVWRKQNGTVYEFEPIPSAGGGTASILSHLYRAKSITDRTGNKLIYQYTDSNPNFPKKIYYENNPKLAISLTYIYNDGFKLATATDPEGNIYRYNYDADKNLESVEYPIANIATQNSPKLTNSRKPVFNYRYGKVNKNPTGYQVTHHIHVVTQSKDPLGRQVDFRYIYHRVNAADEGNPPVV